MLSNSVLGDDTISTVPEPYFRENAPGTPKDALTMQKNFEGHEPGCNQGPIDDYKGDLHTGVYELVPGVLHGSRHCPRQPVDTIRESHWANS